MLSSDLCTQVIGATCSPPKSYDVLLPALPLWRIYLPQHSTAQGDLSTGDHLLGPHATHQQR